MLSLFSVVVESKTLPHTHFVYTSMMMKMMHVVRLSMAVCWCRLYTRFTLTVLYETSAFRATWKYGVSRFGRARSSRTSRIYMRSLRARAHVKDDATGGREKCIIFVLYMCVCFAVSGLSSHARRDKVNCWYFCSSNLFNQMWLGLVGRERMLSGLI